MRKGSLVVVKCELETHEGPQEYRRLRMAGPLTWEALQKALGEEFGPPAGPAAYKYTDDQGDLCSLGENTFEDFLQVNAEELRTTKIVKLQVSRGGPFSP